MADELRQDGVHLEREYDAPPEDLWDAWTSTERLARWLGVPDAPLAADPVRLTFGEGADDWADVHVQEQVPERLLELGWSFPGRSGSTLRVELKPRPEGGTRLVIDHTGLGDSSVGYGAGWSAYLDSLDADLRGADGRTAWDDRFAAALPAWRARASATEG